MVSATRFDRSVDKAVMALTLGESTPPFFIHCEPRSSSGRMEQKMFICFTVIWRAISSGSKSRMVGHVAPIFQLAGRLSWLLVTTEGGSGVSAGLFCVLVVLVLLLVVFCWG